MKKIEEKDKGKRKKDNMKTEGYKAINMVIMKNF